MDTEPMSPEEFQQKHKELEEQVRNLQLGALACLLQARRITQRFIDDLNLEVLKITSRQKLEKSLAVHEKPAVEESA